MKKNLISLAVLGALATSSGAVLAEEAAAPAAPAAAAAPASPWTITTNLNFVSDYYFRGISQTWHKPAVQGGVDISHSSGAYAGAWFSNVSDNTFGDGQLEVDYYFGYNGSVPAVEGLGWTVGGYGYYYPGASYKQTTAPVNEDYNTFEVNAGVSYKWLSAKVSYDLTDWYGANKKTGFKDDTRGSTYIELNAAVPLPVWDLTLIGHVGHENVTSSVDGPAAGYTNETSPDYTDYKIGLSKSLKIAASEGWSAGVYYVGATNDGKNDYWGKNGWGGADVSGGRGSDLADAHFVFTIGRVF